MVTKEYERLQNKMETDLNQQSLLLNCCDILALSETQIIHSDSRNIIERGIFQCTLKRQDHFEDRNRSMACLKSPV